MTILWACSLSLAACPWYPEAWRLQLFIIDQDPGPESGPGIGHDLELSCDAQQLARISM